MFRWPLILRRYFLRSLFDRLQAERELILLPSPPSSTAYEG